MVDGEKITIQFNGKDVQVVPVQPGLVQKSDSIYYIRDCVTGEYLYAFPARVEKLREKLNNDFSQYKGRESKAADKKAAKASPKASPAVDAAPVVVENPAV